MLHLHEQISANLQSTLNPIEWNTPDKMVIRIEYVGEHGYPILIADNVYKDPYHVRSALLETRLGYNVHDAYPSPVLVIKIDSPQ